MDRNPAYDGPMGVFADYEDEKSWEQLTDAAYAFVEADLALKRQKRKTLITLLVFSAILAIVLCSVVWMK